MTALWAKVVLVFLFGTLGVLAATVALGEYKAVRDNTVCSAIQPNYP